MLKPYMLRPITNAEEAVDFICYLYLDRKIWHFDDDPADFVINGPLDLPAFTDKEVEYLRQRQKELFTHLQDPHEIPVCLMNASIKYY